MARRTLLQVACEQLTYKWLFLLISDSRLVWAVVYTLFLSLGLGIGSEIWDSFGPSQPGNHSDTSDANATEVLCYRDPSWDYWWYTERMSLDLEV